MTLPMFPSIFSFLAISFVVCFHISLAARIQPGIFFLNFTPEKTGSATVTSPPRLATVLKSIFNDTSVKLTINDATEDNKKDEEKDTVETVEYTIGWVLRYTQCEELYGTKLTAEGPGSLEDLYHNHSAMFSVENYISVINFTQQTFHNMPPELNFGKSNESVCYVQTHTKNILCQLGDVIGKYTATPKPPTDTEKKELPTDAEKKELPTDAEKKELPTDAEKKELPTDAEKKELPTDAEKKELPTDAEKKERKRRDDDDKKVTVTPKNNNHAEVTKTQESGNHLLILELNVIQGTIDDLIVKVDMKGPHGYLSAFQYPLLKFYGIMCGLYILLGFTWLFLLCYQYKDLLGIQIWIGAVIFLGLVEKAVFFAEFEHVNNNGLESTTGILFPELVSCLKRTLARLLVVVVSIGYGITRPRLGNDLNYVMAAGLLYMVLSSAEAIMRTSNTYERNMAAILPLSVLDAVLVWWIFRNLVDTTRTLRLRQNDVKLWLYRHFTNTLLLCIVLSIIYFLWSIKTHKYNECVTKWHELWLDDAFWHILFCVILVVVMVLFRPSVNTQRYAYSPLIDEEQQDEESKEPMLSDAYDGMKMRNIKKDNPQNDINEIADDLKWVEDNIPAAIADTALSMMDDSEEELVTNLERSKMD